MKRIVQTRYLFDETLQGWDSPEIFAQRGGSCEVISKIYDNEAITEQMDSQGVMLKRKISNGQTRILAINASATVYRILLNKPNLNQTESEEHLTLYEGNIVVSKDGKIIIEGNILTTRNFTPSLLHLITGSSILSNNQRRQVVNATIRGYKVQAEDAKIKAETYQPQEEHQLPLF